MFVSRESQAYRQVFYPASGHFYIPEPSNKESDFFAANASLTFPNILIKHIFFVGGGGRGERKNFVLVVVLASGFSIEPPLTPVTGVVRKCNGCRRTSVSVCLPNTNIKVRMTFAANENSKATAAENSTENPVAGPCWKCCLPYLFI